MTWTEAPLEELCDIDVGRTPARANPAFWGTGEPWLSIADMNQGRLILSTKEQITPLAASAGNRVAPGTVLLSFKLSIGKVGIAGVPLFTNEAIAALPIRRPDLILPEFLAWALESKDLSGGSNRAAMGATLNKAMLRRIRIPIPTIREQRRIAAALNSVESLRSNSRSVRLRLSELAGSVYENMFGDPVRNDRGFEPRVLGDWVKAGSPITYGILKPGPDVVNGVPYIRVTDIQDGAIRADEVRRTSPEIEESYARSRLTVGDLVISIRGHVGRVGLVPAELQGANITQDSARIRVSSVAREYVAASLESPGLSAWMARRTKGAAVKGINLGDLRLAPLPLPPEEEMLRFSERVAQLRAASRLEVRRSALIEELFGATRSCAFDGGRKGG